ncbi:MAG: radical SAM protein [Bacillota bacterium]|nr:radical SAM protein [Bacillota bacterium]
MAVRKPAYEQGPIRPPSEAHSLLLRLTRNCPWNKCLFCPIYKGEKFSRRSVDEIKEDIAAIADAVDKIKTISHKQGFNGVVNSSVFDLVQNRFPEYISVAFWLYHGGENVFLQDGDGLRLSREQLQTILKFLNEKIPGITRITTYARSKSILRYSVEDLSKLKNAGLSRIHVGLESGNDRVLEFMNKGVSAAEHVEAGQRVVKAGISLSEYVLIGLGGRNLWREHALDTAKVLNEINPDFIRVRTLAVHPVAPLYEAVQQGTFIPLDDDTAVKEELLLIEHLDNINSHFFSDHVLNLLEEVNGRFPEEKEHMINLIRTYLSYPDREREIFRLGRRMGYFRQLKDLSDIRRRSAVEEIYEQLRQNGMDMDRYIAELMLRFI